jgi:hypothetical protein
MAEAMLIGAGLGAGGAMLSGQDPLKGAAVGGAMGGASAGFGSAGVASGAGAEGVASTVPSHLTTEAVGSTVANNTMNPALTNGLGESSNPFTQFSRDAYQNVGQHVDSAFNNVTDTVGQGFDWLNDKTGLENKDYTMLALNQGANLLQPTPEQPIQHAPVGQGISKPNMDLTKSNGLLSSLPPMTPQDEQVLSQSNTLTPEQIMKLKQQGIL